MDKIGNLILIYACLVFSTVSILSYLAIYPLEYYLTAFALEYYAAILITSPYNQAESKRQLLIGVAFVVIFVGIVIRHALLLLGVNAQ